jgi:hypothetical protein
MIGFVEMSLFGRIVHWVDSKGKHFPAIIFEVDEHAQVYKLHVFGGVPSTYVESKRDDQDKKPGTFHWPEGAPEPK